MAVLLVVAFHAGLPIPGGFLGVDVFFVISGFVIARMLTREWSETGQIDLVRFYWRRFKRLTPALALVIAVTLMASAFLLSPLGTVAGAAAKTGIGAMFLSANMVIHQTTGAYFDAPAERNPLLHMWSLSVEEQFYLLFPVLLIIGSLWSRRWKLAPAAIIVTVSVISFGLANVPHLVAGLSSLAEVLLGFYSPVSRAWEFGAGALLAMTSVTRPASTTREYAAFAGAAGLLVSVFVIDGSTGHPGYATLLPVCSTLLIIWAGSGQTLVSRVLSSKPMVWLGDLSYSWYLWHWPAIVLTTAYFGFESTELLVVSAAASIGPATAGFYLIEQPIRGGPTGNPAQSWRLAIVCISLPLVSAVLLLQLMSAGYFSPVIQRFQTDVERLHLGAETHCSEGLADSYTSDRCLWNGAASGKPIYVVGDSNADHLSEGVLIAAENVDRPVRMAAMAGCAFIGRSWSNRTEADQINCLGYLDSLTDFLTSSAPKGTIVVGLTDSLWTAPEIAIGPDRASESTDRVKVLAYLQAQLQEFVETMQTSGHQVFLVQSVPKFVVDGAVVFDLTRCSAISVATESCHAFLTGVDKREEMQRQADGRAATLAVAHNTGAGLLDFWSVVCPEERCLPIRENRATYRDAGHLTVFGSAMLAPAFENALAR